MSNHDAVFICRCHDPGMNGFDDLLIAATERIEPQYMQLPIAGKEDPVYRERVYCYELYHQLRKEWPADSYNSLGGEVDKKGHPLIRGNGLDDVKPDFLIHDPGNMGGNYLVMEVKPIVARHAGLRKDLVTLTAFRLHGEYQRAMLLLYGHVESIDPLLNKIKALAAKDHAAKIALGSIEVWWHSAPGTAVHRVL